ncbi:sensor histidine kinase [Lacrimispora indolis]|uniref:sensor histidine kinase n=1 Tax=Lacrimispora indolis TaxID=69825 RepID=UPI00041F07CA|nr:histidine kinase [[Clostridium] methoxybenzovorans]
MRKRLSSMFVITILIPVMIIMIYQLFVLDWLNSHNQQKLDTYGENTSITMTQNISLMLGNLVNAAQTFTYSHEVQSMAAGELAINPVRINTIIMMAQRYNPDAMDVLLTDMNGTTYSLKGYLSQVVEQYVKEYAGQHYTSHQPATFTIFEQDTNKTSYLLYSAPVFATNMAAHYGKQVGVISILCSTKQLQTILQSTDDMQAELVSADTGQILLKNSHSYPKGRVYTQRIPGTGLELRCTASGIGTDDESSFFLKHIVISIIIMVLLFIYLAWIVHRLFLKSIMQMNREICLLNQQDTTARLKNIPENEIGSIATYINQMLDMVHGLNQRMTENLERLYQADLLKKKTQLYAYQSQINPHFLYNMLQCMRGIALTRDMRDIADICTSMATIFRYSIKGETQVPLERELFITDLYLNMLRVRFQDRVQYMIDVDPSFGVHRIAKLTLQPLVENAVFHGLAPNGYEGTITITAQIEYDQLYLKIHDDGVGIQPNLLESLRQQMESPIQMETEMDEDAHIGIINVHNKLRLCYGMEYGLCIESKVGDTTVTVLLPLQEAFPEEM